MATKFDVHIFLVVHPKKVEDDTKLNTGSIYGSSKITQEADNVMILQKSPEGIPNYRTLQVMKNRYDGEIGNVGLAFNPDNRRYFEITHFERDLFFQSNGNIKKLCEARINKFGVVEPRLTALDEQVKDDEDS